MQPSVLFNPPIAAPDTPVAAVLVYLGTRPRSLEAPVANPVLPPEPAQARADGEEEIQPEALQHEALQHEALQPEALQHEASQYKRIWPTAIDPTGTTEASLSSLATLIATFPPLPTSHWVPPSERDRISCVLIVEANRLVGIVTERDIIRALATGYDLNCTPLARIMTADPITLPAQHFERVSDALCRLQKNRIRHLPIVDQHHCPIGVVTAQSLRRLLNPVDLLQMQRVQDAMMRSVVQASADAPVLELVWLMSAHRIGSVVIVVTHGEDVVPIGIVTEHDIIQLQIRQGNLQTTSAREVMSAPVRVAQAQESLWDAHQRMQACGIARLVVVDDRGQLCGIVSQTQLLSILDPLALQEMIGDLSNQCTDLHQVQVETLRQARAELDQEVQRRQEMERTMQKREERLQALLAMSQEFQWTADAEGRLCSLNETMAVCLGRSPDELIGHPWTQWMSAAAAAEFTAWFPLRSPHWIGRREVSLLRPDGATVTLSLAVVALDPGTDGVCYWGVGEDVTEQYHTESNLQRSRQWIDYLITIGPAVLYSYRLGDSPSLTYISANCLSLLGHTSDALLHSPQLWYTLVVPEDQPLADLHQAAQSDRPHGYCEYRIQLPHGQRRWIGNRFKIVRDRQGQPIEIIGYLSDISNYKQAEIELLNTVRREKELRELKARFISNISHEFRTPLSVALSSAGLLQEYGDRLPAPKHQKHLERICEAIKQMTHLLDDTLILDRTESGQVQCVRRPVDPVQVCCDFVTDQNAKLPTPRLYLTLNPAHPFPPSQITPSPLLRPTPPPPNPFPPVWLDITLLLRILTNLVSNALKYSPPDRPVMLAIHQQQHHIIFRVIDQGIGIPSTDLPYIFDAFHRGLNVDQRPGTGLGLRIAKRCADLHGATLKVESQLQIGTMISVMIPLVVADPGADPGVDPGVDPGADPGTDPETNPSTDLDPFST